MNNNNMNEKSADDLLDDLFSEKSDAPMSNTRKNRGSMTRAKREGDSVEINCSEPKSDRKSAAALAAVEWLEMFVSCFAVVLIIVTFVARHSPVIGTSMTHTLRENDVVIVQQLFYEPEQGDIIVAQSVPLGYDEPIVKRVIATEGQTVDIDFDTWTVTVYDPVLDTQTVLDEYYVRRDNENVPMIHKDVTFPLTVPEGYLFVMGDNRNGSMDSRDSRVGLIDERMVVGHVIFRILPFDAFGTLS